MNRSLKYPLYPRAPSWVERAIVKLRFAGPARCLVCGAVAPIVVEDENLRETCVCRKCGSFNRQRQIAYIACRAISRVKGTRLSSLRAFQALEDLVVYNTECQGAIHRILSPMKHYLCSEYLGPEYRSGDVVDGFLCQDLTDLSFDTESIDLVLSGDVLEHIPDPYQAHREVHRVLKPGGRHIFTVPFHQTDFVDDVRAELDAEGQTVLLKDPIYHSDPIRAEGTLVYTIFALEMLVKLHHIGFTTNLYHLFRPRFGIWGPNAIVFEAIRPAG